MKENFVTFRLASSDGSGVAGGEIGTAVFVSTSPDFDARYALAVLRGDDL